MHVCVSVEWTGGGGGVGGQRVGLKHCPPAVQVGDFVIRLPSDPQSVDTLVKSNMHMLSSFHAERRVSWLLRFPSRSLYRLFVQRKCHFKLDCANKRSTV